MSETLYAVKHKCLNTAKRLSLVPFIILSRTCIMSDIVFEKYQLNLIGKTVVKNTNSEFLQRPKIINGFDLKSIYHYYSE